MRLALQTFDQAAIFTIHGFCQRAIADAPFVAGAPLSTELLTSDDELRLEVVQDFWRRSVAGPALPAALVQALRAAGDSPASFAQLLRQSQARPLARVIWGDLEDLDDGKAAQAELVAHWHALQALWPEARQSVPVLLARVQAGFHQNAFKPESLATAHESWNALLASGDPWSVTDEKCKLALYRRDRLVLTAAAVKRGLTPPDHPLFDVVQGFLDARAALADLGDALRRRLLRDMLAHCGPALRDAKRALRVQAFDDMLYNLHAALQSTIGVALAESLRARFPAALVDEFQDTDPLQWQILQAVYGDCALPRFLVGDPKQAIYRFRNADLPTYLAARQCVSEALRHTLSHNQRSSAGLIAACNALFGANPAAFIDAGLHYPPVAVGAKRKAVLVDQRPTARAALQVWLLPADEAGAALLLDPARRMAAECCAAEVVSLLQGASDGQVWLRDPPSDRGTSGQVALQAGDIAVLVQSHTQGRLMRMALEARGVQCVELSQANVFATADATSLLRILQAVLAPAREALVRDALATPWLGFSALQIDDLAATQQGLAPMMAAFAQALARWRSRGFAVMMRRLLERHDVHARLLQRPDGPRRLTNLRQLLELAHAASRTHAGAEALEMWLRHQIDQSQARDDSAQLRLESDAQLVHIVTVHAAKGLEYPVVFCPFLWVNSAARSSTRDCVDYPDPQGGHGLVLDYRSAAERTEDDAAIKAARQGAEDAERLRLIYVALTRAAQRCYLVAGVYASGKPGKDGTPNLRATATSPLNWLLTGAGQEHTAWRKTSPRQADLIEGAWHALADRVNDVEALAVGPMPAWSLQPLAPQLPDPAELQALPVPLHIPPRRRVGSYSGLVSAGGHASAGFPAGQVPVFAAPALATESGNIESPVLQEFEQRDHDAQVDLQSLPEAAPVSLHQDDILQFPRGADAGTCLHAVLEQIDFQDAQHWPEVSRQVLLVQGLPLSLQPMVLNLLHDVLHTPLPTGFCLAQVAASRRKAELEFHLPALALEAEVLQMVLDRHQIGSMPLQFADLHGHLKGFIDLVFQHEGRWYVLDWKSNHLGHTPGDYGAAALRQAMAQHSYGLQALLYLLALDRFLACRLQGYRREQHLGGALYLFVRGVRPAWQQPDGQAAGVWYLPARGAALDDLGQALAGRPLTQEGA